MKSTTSPSLLLLCLLAALAGAGCGLFDTAVAPPPTQEFPVPPPNFDLPDSTLATLERSVEHRLTSDYALCFTDSAGNGEPGFYQSFDPSDLADWLQNNPPPGVWTLEREIQFIPRFLSYIPNFYQVTFDTLRPDFPIDSETVVWNRTYRVFAAGSPVAAGAAVLTFKRVGLAGQWKISFWEDLRDTSGMDTWGLHRLRGR